MIDAWLNSHSHFSCGCEKCGLGTNTNTEHLFDEQWEDWEQVYSLLSFARYFFLTITDELQRRPVPTVGAFKFSFFIKYHICY